MHNVDSSCTKDATGCNFIEITEIKKIFKHCYKFLLIKMWTNAPSTIHAKTELSAPTHTEDTHAPVVAALLERTAIKVSKYYQLTSL